MAEIVVVVLVGAILLVSGLYRVYLGKRTLDCDKRLLDLTQQEVELGGVRMTPASCMNYSEKLVALARSLDCAEVCVRAANWHFSQIEEDDPEQFNDAGEYHAWTWGNILNLEQSLPSLRATFLSMVKEESKGWDILPNELGDAVSPKEVDALMKDVVEHPVFRLLPSNESPAKLLELPVLAKSKVGDNRVVVWDDEIYVIPSTMTDSFVEVWFRRAFGWNDDGGAYPVYLVKRQYGWQAYGIER